MTFSVLECLPRILFLIAVTSKTYLFAGGCGQSNKQEQHVQPHPRTDCVWWGLRGSHLWYDAGDKVMYRQYLLRGVGQFLWLSCSRKFCYQQCRPHGCPVDGKQTWCTGIMFIFPWNICVQFRAHSRRRERFLRSCFPAKGSSRGLRDSSVFGRHSCTSRCSCSAPDQQRHHQGDPRAQTLTRHAIE